jgi:hypothetical protein
LNLLQLYVWFLLLSALLGLVVLLGGLATLFGRRRSQGFRVLAFGLVGAIVTAAVYATIFVLSGGWSDESVNEVGLLWAFAGFGWVGGSEVLARLRSKG